jgi:opacity protein-like surface antigen
MLKRVLIVLTLAAATLTPAAMGDAPRSVNGGGRGTVDGVTAFSQFGFQVSQRADGSVRGHFNCLMAGSSRFPPFTLMAVRGEVTSLSISAGTATFEGSGMLQTGNQGKAAATFEVVVTGGGPGAGTLKLTVQPTLLTPFVVSLPIERVLDGHITVD